MVVVGGITRLTHSGLSIVKWEPVRGAIPPLTAESWQEAFRAYQSSPEYKVYNSHFSLREFKQIYFWEYFHRLLGRIVGLVFLFPSIYFWVKGAFNSKLKKQVVIIFLGGLFQGALGWYMVMSGMVDKPYVSHYRLAAHLITALALIAYIFWVALEVRGTKGTQGTQGRVLHGLSVGMLVLVGVQILYGAFVAGLKAGLMYNTFPMMGHQWIPEELGIAFQMNGLMALLESHGVVQLIHRIMGVAVLVMACIIWAKTMKLDNGLSRAGTVLFTFVGIQVLLGILTLIYAVPFMLGVLHQFGAVLVLLNLIYLCFITRTTSDRKKEEGVIFSKTESYASISFFIYFPLFVI